MSAPDMLAVIIALGVSMTLIITSTLQNARLTRSRDHYRQAYISSSARWAKRLECECECEC